MRTPDHANDVAEVLIPEPVLQAKVAELGARLSADYAGKPVTLVSVLKGSLPFMADLMRAMTIPLTIDLMEVSSYGGAVTETLFALGRAEAFGRSERVRRPWPITLSR